MSDKEKLDYFLRLLDDNFILKAYAGIELTYEELHYLTEKLAKEIEYRERVRELETVIEQDERQAVLEGLYEQNKRYREAREIIEQVYKESYVRNAYGYEEGYLDGLDTAINIIDEALEE